MIEFDYARLPLLEKFAYQALTNQQGRQHTYVLAKEALKVSGAFVECGVAYGGSAGVMLQAMVDAGDIRALHLVDSFQGIPLSGPKDRDQPGIGPFVADVNLPLAARLRTSGISSCSKTNVQRNFQEWGLPTDLIVYHEGWFQNSLPTAEIGDIAMLRLDGDLYESIECCMQWLYPKVVSGGIVLSDDWTPVGKGHDAIRDYFGGDPPGLGLTVDTGACYWIKP